MREAQYTAALRKELVRHLYVLKLNAAYARGVPDCYYSGSRGDLWNEHKKVDKIPPVLDLTDTTITTQLQQMWLAGRHAEGRSVAMIVFSPEGHLLLPGLTWMEPITRDEFRSRMKNKKDLAKELIELLGPIKGPILP